MNMQPDARQVVRAMNAAVALEHVERAIARAAYHGDNARGRAQRHWADVQIAAMGVLDGLPGAARELQNAWAEATGTDDASERAKSAAYRAERNPNWQIEQAIREGVS